MKVELDLSTYATKANLKYAAEIDTSSFAKKVDLPSFKSNVDKLDTNKLKNVPTYITNLKSKVDKLDVDKLIPVPVDLSKLIDVVKNELTSKSFAARLKKANLASKSDFADIVNKADFDNKVEDVTSNKNKLNEQLKNVKAISAKGLTKDLIDKFSISNGAKHFSLGMFQNYLYLYQLKNTLYILLALLGMNHGNLMECQKKILKT